MHGVFAFALLLLATACATLVPKPLPPQVLLDGVRVTRLAPLDTRMSFALIVHNPNAYALAVSAFDATLAVEGDRLLTGSLVAPVSLAANADTKLEIEARTDYLAIAAALDRFTRQRSVTYEVNGSATVQDGILLPFTRRGELSTADFSGMKR